MSAVVYIYHKRAYSRPDPSPLAALAAPTPVFRPGIACCTATAQRTASTTLAKFHQHAVAGGLDDGAVMFADFRIEELAAQRFEAFERAFLIRPHQPRIPRYIATRTVARRRLAVIPPTPPCAALRAGERGLPTCTTADALGRTCRTRPWRP